MPIVEKHFDPTTIYRGAHRDINGDCMGPNWLGENAYVDGTVAVNVEW